MHTDTPHTERFNMRMPASARDLLELAAQHQHVSVSQFILQHAVKAAEDVLAQQTKLQLNDKAFDAFLQALDQPPTPNTALEKAYNWYHGIHS